jgi:hypothetical protein
MDVQERPFGACQAKDSIMNLGIDRLLPSG